MRRLLKLFALSSLLSVTGCLELMQAYTLNPDGSGKVVIDTVTPARNQFAPQDKPQKPEDIVKEAIQERISGGAGIDAWSDISCELTKEGKIHFRGTAYFSDINALKADNGGGGGDLSWTKQGDAMVLMMKSKNEGQAGQPVPDAEVDQQVQQEKMQYQQMKPMMAAMFDGMKVEISARLPGKVAEANIFTQKDNVATLQITGKQMMAAMEKINGDDKLLKAKIKAGKGKGEDDFMFEQIFGKKGPAQVKVTGANAPLFDYKAEVAKAKAGEAAMFKNLGVTPPAK
ncbi:hypothetical protein [Humisphaera borealis]|uniref:Uncharacterized protein n=1 Tax=Humisphaera borealis TaxID=2807512 RepID=A0A7M2X342_9BACT|nr:hypothetical protein [Humisphaera borealis]QOV92178.1 hypothetical protein IPV69_12810 [Humisphaera borealis]